MASKGKFFEDQITKASPDYKAPPKRDEYSAVEIPTGKKADGSVDAGSMKNRFELLANPPPPPKTRGTVAWNDEKNQGAKKLHRAGNDPTKPPPKRSITDLP
eukprot:TRINITY_DN804_c1_g1_i1.p1 TRINITY_DN804_c1_g1~~TRINITY_DN804_c1_g1_i1.p1  ORF type:complete len:102 (-),score=30.85 TRINITY_DN804_c1_g1_i1:81-386(-)